MTKNEKSVATVLQAYYRLKNEKMPMLLKCLIFNYNIQALPYGKLLETIKLGPNDSDGNIDGDKEDEEVIRFLLDPSNAYTLGRLGQGSNEEILCPYRINELKSLSGLVVNEGNVELLLK